MKSLCKCFMTWTTRLLWIGAGVALIGAWIRSQSHSDWCLWRWTEVRDSGAVVSVERGLCTMPNGVLLTHIERPGSQHWVHFGEGGRRGRSFSHSAYSAPRLEMSDLAGIQSNWNRLGFYWRSRRELFPGQIPPDPGADGWMLAVPFWACVAVLLIPCAVPVRRSLRARTRRQRASRGECEMCGYDVRASTARCPECGHPLPSGRMDGRQLDDREGAPG
jgi:hypothetical protein